MIFKTIPGYEPLEVSDTAVIRHNGRIIKQTLRDTGYYVIRIPGTKKDLKVHRAVAFAFLPPPPSPEHKFVCHEDGSRTNNVPSNLRWDTRRGNEADKLKHGTLIHGEKHYACKLTDADVLAIKKDTRKLKEIAADYAVSISYVSNIRTGYASRHVLRASAQG